MVYRKAKRMHPKRSHHKDNLSSFLSIVCTWDDSWAYCGNHFTIYVNQTITLYALNLPNDVHRLFLNKTGGNKRKRWFWKVCLVSLGVLTSVLQRHWINRIHIYTYICMCIYIYIGIHHFIALCLICFANTVFLANWRSMATLQSTGLPVSFFQQRLSLCSVQFSRSVVSDSLPPMNPSTPGLPVQHQLPESTQTHVHRVGDAIQPSHLLLSPSPPAPNPSQHQGLFQWVNSSHEVTKVLEFQPQHQSFQWTPRTGLL